MSNSYTEKQIDIGKGLLGLGDYFNKNSKAIGVLGGLYGAYNTQDMAGKNFNLQRDAFNYNKMLSKRQIKRQDASDASLKAAFNNSSYVRKS